MGVLEGIAVSVDVGVSVGVGVSVAVGVEVGDGMGVKVAVGVEVDVADGAMVADTVGATATEVGVGAAPHATTVSRTRRLRKATFINWVIFISSLYLG